MTWKWIVMIPIGIAAIIVFATVGGGLVMWLWNWLLPPLFAWPAITFWQALGLLALCRILFGGMGGGRGCGGDESRGAMRSRFRDRFVDRMADRVAQRMERMTPEERERFRRRLRERGFDASAGGDQSAGAQTSATS